MLHKFLLIPVTVWLLLPPGICVCQGFGNLLPFLAAKTSTVDTGSTAEDTEHAPWCPEHKMSYLTNGAPSAHSVDTGLVGVLPAFVADLSPHGSASQLDVPTVHPADSPLYLNLCALRI